MYFNSPFITSCIIVCFFSVGDTLVKEMVGKAEPEVVEQMKAAGVKDAHNTHARELLDFIATWHESGLPADYTPCAKWTSQQVIKT